MTAVLAVLAALSVLAGATAAPAGTAAAGESGVTATQQDATFDVRFHSTNAPIVEGETLEVKATVTNTGDETGTESVELAINDFEVDSTEVTLLGGESRVVTLTWETEEGVEGEYEATLTTGDDAATRTVSVEDDDGEFDVEIDETNEPVVEGNTLKVEATVTNRGETTDTQRIELNVDGSTVASTSVRLDPSESSEVDLEWETEVGDADGYSAIVASDDTTDTAEVTIREQGEFDVEIDETNEPVVEGETLEVEAVVENTGDAEATGTIGLTVAGNIDDTTTLTLDDDESETVTLEWETDGRLPGTYTATVAAEDGASKSTEIEIQEPAVFDVAIDRTDAPIVEGDTLVVDAAVENTGEAEATQTVELLVDGTTIESSSVTVSGGETETVSLTWGTSDGDAGDHTVTVVSEDTENATTITVQESAAFAVEINSTTAPVIEGDPLEVTATVQNTGEVAGTRTVNLSADGETIESTTLTLEGGESEQLTLTWATTDGDAGGYTATVASGDDDDSTGVTVVAAAGSDGPQFDVAVETTNDPVTEGKPVELVAMVENRGEETDTQPITLTVAGTEHERRQLTVDGGEAERLTLTWETLHGDAGEHTVTVASPDEEAAATVTVSEADEVPEFAVQIGDVVAPGGDDGRLVVTATVENVGDRADTQAVTLTAAGTERASQAVTLDGGENETIALTWATDDGEDGVELAVASETNSNSTTASLEDEDEGPFPVPAWSLLLVLPLLLGAGYYYFQRRNGGRP
jgi:hypothetical protein